MFSSERHAACGISTGLRVWVVVSVAAYEYCWCCLCQQECSSSVREAGARLRAQQMNLLRSSCCYKCSGSCHRHRHWHWLWPQAQRMRATRNSRLLSSGRCETRRRGFARRWSIRSAACNTELNAPTGGARRCSSHVGPLLLHSALYWTSGASASRSGSGRVRQLINLCARAIAERCRQELTRISHAPTSCAAPLPAAKAVCR